ncbi:MAG: copper ion binding protein [Oscillospiraceae bacterium]|jgi:copper ion binding protein|nr:copper ion binding protein [Oscillospiraceae bacterium]
MESTIVNVGGMSCEHCVKAVTDAVSALDGVVSVKVSLEEGTAAVEYDAARVAPGSIKAAIADEGYEV